jgi:hypothetical protein
MSENRCENLKESAKDNEASHEAWCEEKRSQRNYQKLLVENLELKNKLLKALNGNFDVIVEKLKSVFDGKAR